MAKYKLKNISTPLELLKTVNDLKVNAGRGGNSGDAGVAGGNGGGGYLAVYI